MIPQNLTGYPRNTGAGRTAAGQTVLAFLAIIGPSSVSATQAPDSMVEDAPAALVAQRIPDGMEIRLDGELAEEAWASSTPISDFTQQEPAEGAQPSERTEVRVVYDDENLYIGALMFDAPEGILAFQKARDASLGTDDRFMWMLDTFLGLFTCLHPWPGWEAGGVGV